MRKINFETSLQIFLFIPGIYDFREKGTKRHTTVDLSSSKICLLTLHAWQCHGVSYLYHFNRNYLHPDCWCDKHLVMHLLITPKQFKRHKYFTYMTTFSNSLTLYISFVGLFIPNHSRWFNISPLLLTLPMSTVLLFDQFNIGSIEVMCTMTQISFYCLTGWILE